MNGERFIWENLIWLAVIWRQMKILQSENIWKLTRSCIETIELFFHALYYPYVFLFHRLAILSDYLKMLLIVSIFKIFEFGLLFKLIEIYFW